MLRSVIVLSQAFWSIGTVFEVLLALWIMPLLGWRWLLGLSTIPVAIFIICCYVSEFWLLFKSNLPSYFNKGFQSCTSNKMHIALFFCATQTKWLPESPRFNILMGQREKAMTTIANIAKENNRPMPQGRISIFKQVSTSKRGRRSSW